MDGNLESRGGRYVAVFNLGDAAQDVRYGWKDLGLPEGGHAVRDRWARGEVGTAGSLKTSLAPHAAMLYKVALIEESVGIADLLSLTQKEAGTRGSGSLVSDCHNLVT